MKRIKIALLTISLLTVTVFYSFSDKSTKNKNTIYNMTTPLKYLVKEPSGKRAVKRGVVLLHGVGSNEQDLFGLANQFPEDMYVISARGPITISNGSYAWYHVDFSSGKSVINSEQEKSSRKIIDEFVRSVKMKYKLEELYIGGFSQGAIMSFNAALTNASLYNGIIILSGRLMQEIKPSVKESAELKKLKVFVGHGIQDGTLQIDYAREAKKYLEGLQLQISYNEYQMGHQIIYEEMKDLNAWLE